MDTDLNKNSINTKDKNLLGLAVKCRLISNEQEKKILSIFLEEQNKDPKISIIQIFRGKKYLSEEEINFLFAVQKHLKMKMLDKQFGELGIANKFVNPESVKKALDLQNEIFRETRESKLIGDILFEQKKISRANKASILLTQDRVEDEFLEEAINDIASTEMERISINMRLGAIAVKKELISLDQLNQALKVQKTEEKNHKGKRSLGDILKELFGLSTRDLNNILKVQKEFEKQRLSLEKALSLYNQETNTNKRLNRLLEYRFSKSKLAAYISIADKIAGNTLVSDVMIWLKSVGIIYGICDEKSIVKFLDKGTIGSEIKIAEGYAPLEPEDETINFSFDTEPAANNGNMASQTLDFVKKGDIMAKIVPHKEGKPGKDVSGFHIAPPEYKTVPLSCGEGVVKKGNHFLAAIDGAPVLFKNRTLFVTPCNQNYPLEYYSGHITDDLSDRYQSVNLKVDGNIETGGKVTCNNITVNGDVKGQIRATGEIQIKGAAIKPPEKDGTCIISSDEDIFIKKNIANMVIITSKNLSAPASDLISSKVYAFQDILLKNVYSKEDNPTILQIGKNPNLKSSLINQAIDQKKQVLKKLLHADEQEEIENWFNKKIHLPDDYLEQQTILQFLLKLMIDEAFTEFVTFEQKTRELLRRTQSISDHSYSDVFDSASGKKFISKLLTEIRNTPEEKIPLLLREMIDIKFGMHKAAVNAAQRYRNEYDARKGILLKKIEKRMPEITEMKQEIESLYVKKDYLKLSESKIVRSVKPCVRVKNQVEKGTVIKGRQSSLVINQTIFGVKFSERQKSADDSPEIIVEGFYE